MISFDEMFRRYIVPRSNARRDLEMERITGEHVVSHTDITTIAYYYRMQTLLENRAQEMRNSGTFTSYYNLTGYPIL